MFLLNNKKASPGAMEHGQWGQCIGDECGSGGFQTRTLWCVHMEGWTTHHSHCSPRDRPETRRPCFKVCSWHQDLFEWDVSEWAACVLVPFFSNELKLRTECVTAQHGIQRRKVHCVRTTNRTAVSLRICEFFSQKPAVEQACLIPCPQDCIVSDFTSWSSCSRTCGMGLQYRTRHVLATPMYGGAHCPNLTETRTCTHPLNCPAGEEEHQYSLKVGAWSECRLPHDKDSLLSGRTTVDFSSFQENNTVLHHPQPHQKHSHSHLPQHPQSRYPMSWELEVGYQTRQVRCTRSDGKNVMLSLCSKPAPPVTFQSCLMPRHCLVSDWSSWSPCSKTCRSSDLSPGFRLRTRTMTQIPVGGGDQCPALEEKEACNILGDLLPSCPRFVWRTTDWGECRISPLLSQQDKRLANISALCGAGIQTRKTYCVQIPDDTAPHHKKEGFRSRSREVLWVSSSPPESCPHVLESIPCEDPACFHWDIQEGSCAPAQSSCGPGTAQQNVSCVSHEEGKACPAASALEEWRVCNDHPCMVFYWEASPWGPCIQDTSMNLNGSSFWNGTSACAVGVQIRKATCMKMNSGQVINKRCPDSARPETVRPCLLPCKKDCVVTPFSEWTACPADCVPENGSVASQSRYRTIIQRPSNGGQECPDTLYEERECESLPVCPVYRWRTHKWHSCSIVPDSVRRGLAGPGELCGDGLETRGFMVEVCHVPCPLDCKLSDWSAWSACSASCGSGLKIRSKWLREKAFNGGRPCPKLDLKNQCHQNNTRTRRRHILRLPANEKLTCPDLIQSEPCIQNSTCFTYEYKVSDWSTCQLSENAICGQGSKVRRVDCLRGDGKMVELHKCEQFGLVNTWNLSESCEVDCPVSCVLSDWSPWAECSHSCGSQGQSVRSRRILQNAHEGGRPCPSQLTQTKPCPVKPCYNWVLSDWSPCTVEGADCGEGVRRRNLSCVVHLGDWPGTPAQMVHSELCGDVLRRAVQQEMEQPCFVPCPGGKCHSYQWRTGPWSNNQRAVWCQRSDGVNVTGGCYQQKKPTTMRHCHPPCTKPFSHCTPSGVCGCERGYTEVMSSHGFLDYCTRTPGVDSYKKADVKTSSGRLRPGPAQAQDVFSEWTLRPVGPDGRVKIWVYAVIAVGFILILFIIALSFLLCKPSNSSKTAAPQKPLSLAYDGDMDM
ncbi:hypothetical protein WMY93_003325 [Mugilogobius chulae]|uniref:Thrombospondin, type I, domain containing 7Ba n=1 Tax=Mugilogobius chulae TaxID=88201 RepID=A0AAW0PZ06_9GOBI